MNRPPQKLPMGKPLEDRPSPAAAPQQAPTGRQPVGHPKKGNGASIALIILGVLGGGGLLAVLVCGGIVWFVFSNAKKAVTQLDQEISQEAERIRQQANNNPGANNPPWRPSVRPTPNATPIDSVESAAAALGDNDHFRRQRAVQYLKDEPIDDDKRAAVIAAALPQLSDRTRRNDAKAVLERWATADQAPKLIAAADAAYARNDRDTQRAAIQILAATGSDRAAAAIAKYYGTRHDIISARRAFERIGAASAPHLVPYINDRDGGLRQTARDLLTTWEIEDALLAEQSLNDLQSGDDERARAAANWFAAHVIVDETFSPQVSAALIALINNRNVRNDAVAALKFWATNQSAPALLEAASVAHAAQDRDAQRVCIQLLTPMRDARALPAYADYLGTRHDPNTAKAAFAGIGEGASKTLLPFIHHEDGNVRHIARELLSELEVEQTHWLTQSLADLQSGDQNRQREAIRYLNTAEPDESMKSAVAFALLELVDDQRLQRDALNTLPKWATADTVPKLIELLDHEDRNVQSNARTILVATKDPRAVSHIGADFGDDFFKRVEARKHLVAMGPVAETALWPHVTHKDWRVAKDACEVLGEIGTAKSIPILQAAAAQNSSFVKSAAENAIRRIDEAKREVGPMPGVAVAGPSDGTRKMRTWTDADGSNKIDALFIEFALGKVRLRTRDGKFLSLKLNQLSAADRQYVLEQIQR